MRGKALRTASVLVAGLAALTFPVWGPINGASSQPAADPICVPTTATCVTPPVDPPVTPPSGLPTESVLPTALPTGAPSGLPTDAPTGVPTGAPSVSPDNLPLPLSACIGVLRGFSAGCGFTMTGNHLAVAGLIINADMSVLGGLVPTVTPSGLPSGLPPLGSILPTPLPSGAPSGAPSGLPTTGLPSGVPSITPPPVAPPTLPPLPSAAGRRGRGPGDAVRIIVEIVNSNDQVLLKCSGDGAGVAVCVAFSAFHPATNEVLECRAKSPPVGVFGCISY